ncbi:MAG: nucleotidyl transferase AbiEii/AbiGii toxin family protein [Vicinamibacterales bacterium]|nr:nucleotidyl transferase AbiEii/AbiGii toxin family protein [Vicinamibacterales bacterium]
MNNAPTWHPEVLPAGWTEAATDLANAGVLEGFSLAGGTALALQLGHRRSVDLDLFSQNHFDPDVLLRKLVGLPALRVDQVAPGTLHLELHGVLVSFLHFPFPRLFPVREFPPITVLDPRDIACMKVQAISTRGARRDFIDLFMVARHYGLPQVIEWFDQMFATTPYNRVHIRKALAYFEDAEAQPMPDMLIPLDWIEVREFFVNGIRSTTP